MGYYGHAQPSRKQQKMTVRQSGKLSASNGLSMLLLSVPSLPAQATIKDIFPFHFLVTTAKLKMPEPPQGCTSQTSYAVDDRVYYLRSGMSFWSLRCLPCLDRCLTYMYPSLDKWRLGSVVQKESTGRYMVSNGIILQIFVQY